MERVLEFMQRYLKEEYRTIVSQYTERNQTMYEAQCDALTAFAAPGVNVIPWHRLASRPPSARHFEMGERKLKKGDFAQRVLFQVKLYQHPESGHLYRVYLGPGQVFEQAPTYDMNLFLSGADDSLRIISVYKFNQWFPERKTPTHFADNGLGWNYSSGEKIQSPGALLEVRKFQAPHNVSGALAEYNAE